MEGSSAGAARSGETAWRTWNGPASRSTRAARASRARNARPETLMVAHVVLFKPKPTLDDAARRRLIDVFQHALGNIPTIRRAQIGKRVLVGRGYEQLMSVDYEYAAILEFDSVPDLRTYLAHDAHEALGRLFFEAFEVALMYDYQMGEGVADVLPSMGPI
jgi:hypothetical protein